MMIMSQFRFMSKTLAASPFATRKQGKPSYYVNLALPLAANIAEPDNNPRMTPRPIGGIRILSANVDGNWWLNGWYGTAQRANWWKLSEETVWLFGSLPGVTGGNKAWGRFHDSIRMEAISQSWGASRVPVPPLFCWWNGVAESVWCWPELGHFIQFKRPPPLDILSLSFFAS